MLTIIDSIKRYNRRYNRQRGSALIMVLMTMAIIIVVGSSMLFITLSSFSTSVADTNQARATNAATVVYNNIKDSLANIVKTYAIDIPDGGEYKVKFKDNFNNEVDYVKINGVAVSIVLSYAEEDVVLVEVIGECGAQTGNVSFTMQNSAETSEFQITDTFGNAFVMNSSMGNADGTASPLQQLRRIEGDVSINCFETDKVTGVRTMYTRFFNPMVTEGVTGSIYANGDLIIGATDNMIRVRGNIYCDGNLTIRGLDLGVNLPSLVKKTYKDKYIHYYTYAKTFVGNVEVPFSGSTITERSNDAAKVGESMYELVNGTYVPVQVYDEFTHYTLVDLGINTFWTRIYSGSSYTWEKITLNLEEEPVMDYFGASMYYAQADNPGGSYDANGVPTDGGKFIQQYPEGGNIYCSGDIIFDTVNIGNVYTYSAGVFKLTDEDGNYTGGTGSDAIDAFIDALKGDLIYTKYDYYSLAYNPTGAGDGKIPVHTTIGGDVYCQGRIVIAPDTTTSFTNFKGITKYTLSASFTQGDAYLNNSNFTDSNLLYRNPSTFLNIVKDLMEDTFGDELTDAVDAGSINLTAYYNRLNTNDLVNGGSGTGNTIADKGTLTSFINDYKNAYAAQNAGGTGSYNLIKDIYLNLVNNALDEFIIEGYDKSDIVAGDMPGGNYRTPTFATTSNIYVYNDPIRKGMGVTAIEQGEVYASAADDTARVVKNTADDDQSVGGVARGRTVVGDYTYTAALTVKYSTVDVHNIYANGAVSVVSSDVAGFASAAEVKISGTIDSLENISTQYTLLSIGQFITAVTDGASDATVAKDYFGWVKDNTYTGEIDYTFNGSDDSQNFYKEGGFIGIGASENAHNRKIIVLRAHVERTETNNWSNPADVIFNGGYWHDWKHYDGYFTFVNHWTLTSTTYSNYKYVCDYAYCISDDQTKDNNATGKILKGNGEIKNVNDVLGELNATEKALVTYLQTNKNKFTNDSVAFLDFESGTDFETRMMEAWTAEGTFAYATNNPPSDASYTTTNVDQWGDDVIHYKDSYNSSASKSVTAYYYYPLVTLADLDASLADMGSQTVSLNSDIIVNNALMDTECMFALVSNSANNDFGAMANRTFYDGNSFNVSGTTSNNAMTNLITIAESAFANNAIYGMYLRHNNVLHPTVGAGATIEAVFAEISNSTFATVLDSVIDDEDGDPILELLNEVRDNPRDYGTMVEYNAFTRYTGTSGATPVTAYPNANGTTGLSDVERDHSGTLPSDAYSSFYWKLNKDYYYLRLNSNKKDTGTSLNLMDFYNANDASQKHLAAEDNLSIDYNYTNYDQDGNPYATALQIVYSALSINNRSQVDYKIDTNVYFNFSEATENIVFHATDDTSVNDSQVAKRMQFLIDTSERDVYLFFQAPDDVDEDGDPLYQFIFQKCTFQVVGEHNCYILLVGDTSFSANAYQLEVSLDTKGSDTSDSKVGTHFLSGTYQKYNASLVGDGQTFNWNEGFDIVGSGANVICARRSGAVKYVGDMYIMGAGNNTVLFGRGGMVNALVYIPEGTYVNKSTGLFSIIPIGNSSNNSASIVAGNIKIEGSNMGRLTFTAYDINKVGTNNNNTQAAGSVFDVITNTTSTTVRYTWTFKGYYYGY